MYDQAASPFFPHTRPSGGLKVSRRAGIPLGDRCRPIGYMVFLQQACRSERTR